MTAYAVLARGMARELVVPHDLCAVVSWATTLVHARLGPRPAERRTAIINRVDEDGRHDSCFADAHAYLATKIDPRALGRFRLSGVGGGGERGRWNSLSMVPATRCPTSSRAWSSGGLPSPRKAARRRERELKIYMNESWSWRGIVHHHPATFDTVAMDPGLKRSIVADLDPGQGVEARVHDNSVLHPRRRGHRLLLHLQIEQQSLTLSGLLNFIDGLWSTSGEERVVVFTLHHQLQGTPRRGAAPAGADGHACSPAWTPRRPRCRRCCCAASDDVDAALRALVEFLQEKKRAMCRSHQEQSSLKVQSLR
ncbi:AAA-type ATPase-like protein [Oryza sativa Japonica Group]|uniref:AAA-type ATPase-like protein n=1 Tax=Oryza sativa subsp. japonica TaxID=39947 RepID=Q5ZB11_ORYSJ|nr:AAA-type ATPase-like protein [Oryza sativa Japonica Group]